MPPYCMLNQVFSLDTICSICPPLLLQPFPVLDHYRDPANPMVYVYMFVLISLPKAVGICAVKHMKEPSPPILEE